MLLVSVGAFLFVPLFCNVAPYRYGRIQGQSEKNQRKSALFSWYALWNAIWRLQNLCFYVFWRITLVFSFHCLGVPLLFIPCSSMSLLGSSFHFMHLAWDDTSCDVVANRGRCRRWSPTWCCGYSIMCVLACLYARAHQRFCTFCFHNLHTLPLFCHRLSIETRELRQKTWEIFWKNSHVFQIISHVFFFAPTFFKIASSFTKNLLFYAVPALAVFLAFCPLFFYIFSPCSM